MANSNSNPKRAPGVGRARWLFTSDYGDENDLIDSDWDDNIPIQRLSADNFYYPKELKYAS